MRRLLGLVTLLAAVLAWVGPAHAEVRPGQVDDPAGDAVAPGPDLVSAAVDFDTSGTVVARLTFAAAPDPASQAVAVAYLGTQSGGTCNSSLNLAGAVSRDLAAAWGVPGATGAGTRSLAGTTLTLSASDPRLAGDRTCAFFRVVAGQATVDTTAFTDLAVAPAPTPTPTPTPSPKPTPPADPVAPKPTATPLERYDAAVAACQKRRGRARTTCVARAAKLNRAGALVARKRRTNAFLGKAFFRPDIDVGGFCGGACLAGFVVVDDRWAYRGVPEDGPVFVRCTRTTATGDDDGCVRYSLSRDRRTLSAAGKRYRLTRGGRQLIALDDAERPLTRVAVPPAGARYAAVIDNISSFGASTPNPVYSTSKLTFARDGRFAGAGTASGASGQGSDFESVFTSIGPGQRGTYAFEPGGTLALTYGDGRVVRRSAFVAFGDGLSLGTPAKDGLYLDGSPYLADDD